jgi:hypothetical protein
MNVQQVTLTRSMDELASILPARLLPFGGGLQNYCVSGGCRFEWSPPSRIVEALIRQNQRLAHR